MKPKKTTFMKQLSTLRPYRINGERVNPILTVLLLCLMAAMSATANPITREQAMQKASAFLKTMPGNGTLAPVTNRRLAPSAVRPNAPYYVFDRGQDEGFVIVSGDDATVVDVLGYTDKGSFDYQVLPPNMKEWLDGYAAEIEDIQSRERQSGHSVASVAPKAPKTHPKVEQLMTSTWSQGYPYNLTCPEYFTLGRSVTGCVATAMAQILYYNREKSVTETQAAMPAYDTRTSHPTYGQLHVEGIPAGSPIDWDNMKDSYSGSTTDLQKLAVADLMHYCGVAVNMDYTNSSSGAYVSSAYEAFVKYFGYGSSTRYVYYASSNDEWDEIVYAELAERRPVYLAGQNSDGGHAFVTDGYDGNLHYHINWGWGGTCDGYFYLTNLDPGNAQGIGGTSGSYNEGREIIIGLEPENYGTKAMSFSDANIKKVCIDHFDADGDGKLTYDEAAAVTDLGTAFKGNTAIKTFRELHYFTSLTSLPDDAFNGCAQLTSLRLPKKVKAIGARAFKDCSKLSQLTFPTALKSIGEEAFSGCRMLANLTIPDEIEAIEARTFYGCATFTKVKLPVGIVRIGDEAFANCTKLVSMEMTTYQPTAIVLGSGVFSGIDLAQATLTVAQGTRHYFSTTPQWQDFGTIRELRELSGGKFAQLEVGKKYYVYNLGTGRYLTKGEAYGTQAVVGDTPMRFVIRHSSSMPEDCYYLTSEDSGKSGHYLFRTNTDGNVGNGVMAAFVDGTSLTASAFWAIAPVASADQSEKIPVYTFQIPSNGNGYQEGLYWGVQTDHQSGAASPTYGIYGDVNYDEHPRNCQWCLVLYDEEQATRYAMAETLASLISTAIGRRLQVDEEQAVYDNLESTTEELRNAQRSLRKKLNLIDFADDQVGSSCRASFDLDTDGEIGYAEASQIADFDISFKSASITSFDELQYFTNIPDIYGATFDNCTKLTSVVLPPGVVHIYYYAFRNCRQLKSINIPELVTFIGDAAFQNCTSLQAVTVSSPDPQMITLGENVFGGVNLANCTLYVPFGTKEAYAAAAVWKEFGNIVEVRAKAQPRYSPIVADKPGYLMNLATRKFLGKGEAYGTQAIVAKSGMLYQFKRVAGKDEDTYYLYSDQTGQDGKVLFRTTEDQRVGEGVRACFVDGGLSAKAHWKVTPFESWTPSVPIYTIQVPSSDATYVDGEYLGVDDGHYSGAASPTYGVYWDVYSIVESLWVFVTQEDMKAAKETDQLVEQLADLLLKAKAKDIDVADEQAVYDSPSSTNDDFSRAIQSLRQKLHIIVFADSKAKALCILNFDSDGDEELSMEEAAAVSDIGETFKNAASMKSFEELRYFTSLKTIPANAFNGCSNLLSIYIPEKVDTLGQFCFSKCTSLKYMALLNPDSVVYDALSGLPIATFFVPASALEKYQADGKWKNRHLEEYTGMPVVTASAATRKYGATSVTLQHVVSGAPVNGVPVLTCKEVADGTTPVGTYPIYVAPGTITSEGLQCVEGVFTVEPASLRIKAKNYTRERGQKNPDFQVTYSGFKNKETFEVLDKLPVITCEATAVSPVGEYVITVADAEAHNYTITYVDGKLTVNDSTHGDVNGDGIKDIADVLCIINTIAAGTYDKAADTNSDGKVDQGDVETIVNIIVSE
jgi:hypothetical protein